MRKKVISFLVLASFVFSIVFIEAWYPYYLYVKNAKNNRYYTTSFQLVQKMYNDVREVAQDKELLNDGPLLALTTWKDNEYSTLFLGPYSIQNRNTYYLLSFGDYLSYIGWLGNEARQYKTKGQYLGEAK